MASQALADYYLEKSYRKAASTPASVQALPDVGEVTLRGVMAKSAAEQESRSAAEDLELARSRLDERARQAQNRLSLEQDELSGARKGNVWATGISLANLALTGLGGYAQLKEAEKHENLYERILSQKKDLLDLKRRQHEDFLNLVEPFLTTVKGSRRSWHESLKPSSTIQST